MTKRLDQYAIGIDIGGTGTNITILRNLPSKGMAQQRQFLLDQSTSPYSLFYR